MTSEMRLPSDPYVPPVLDEETTARIARLGREAHERHVDWVERSEPR